MKEACKHLRMTKYVRILHYTVLCLTDQNQYVVNEDISTIYIVHYLFFANASQM